MAKTPVSTALLLSLSALLVFASADQAFFMEIPVELRCTGCELTVKTLHYLMISNTGSLDSRVTHALAEVCHEDRFHASEFNNERMSKVCNFITKKHRSDVRRELIEHYQHPTRPTYLEFVQHICLDILKMCAGVSHKQHHHDKKDDTVLHFDSKSHDFTVMPGKNIRMPKPVSENHDEL